MSRDRISKAAGWVDPDRLPRGPNGRALCRECSTEVPRGRRTFCSSECVDSWRIKTDPGFCRERVGRRDHGVCAICRVDTEALVSMITRLDNSRRPGFLRLFRARHGLSHRSYGWAWDTDHTIPVVEGGGGCGIDGYRTLCVWCHRRETRKLRVRLKASK